MNLDTANIATVIVLLIAIVGGIVVVLEPATLNFEEYVKNVGIAAGLLAVGRGLNHNTKP